MYFITVNKIRRILDLYYKTHPIMFQTGFVKMTEQTDRDVCYGHTLAYDAPELKRGPPKDIYSVGCMAYEIVMGW